MLPCWALFYLFVFFTMCLLPTHSSTTVTLLFPWWLHHPYRLGKTAYKDVLGARRKLNSVHEQCYTMKKEDRSRSSSYVTMRNNLLCWIVRIRWFGCFSIPCCIYPVFSNLAKTHESCWVINGLNTRWALPLGRVANGHRLARLANLSDQEDTHMCDCTCPTCFGGSFRREMKHFRG